MADVGILNQSLTFGHQRSPLFASESEERGHLILLVLQITRCGHRFEGGFNQPMRIRVLVSLWIKNISSINYRAKF